MTRQTVGSVLLVLILSCPVFAQSPFPGETLVATASGNDTRLLDLNGSVVQTWNGSGRPSSFAYLLEDGSILRPTLDTGGSFSGGGIGGRIQRIDATDTIVWDYYFSTSEFQQHHDIQPMPNGNVLVIAWERKTNAEATAAGRELLDGEMWPELIAEITPDGSGGGIVVWEWHAWDHLIQDVDPGKPDFGVVADHPELFDINFGTVVPSGDWIHANSIDYDPVRDQIVLSSRSWNEVFVIDHSTSTLEAAGHSGGNSGMGGDILYRWGNPQAYDRGTSTDQEFFVVHGANWIDEDAPGAGNILAFNNGDRPGPNNDYSTVLEIEAPWNGSTYDIEEGQPFGPAIPAWSYGDPGTFYGGPTHCGARRLANGNTLITSRAEDRVFEVTETGSQVWEYFHTGGVNDALRYADPATDVAATPPALPRELVDLRPAAPNPFHRDTRLEFVVSGADPVNVTLEIISLAGERVAVLREGIHTAGEFVATWDGRDRTGRAVASGVYFARIRTPDGSLTRRLVRLD
jgi:hypothetical protein